MPLGLTIRAMFGRHERRIADLYRALFMDLDDFADKIGGWAPGARRILEVGCGEGAVTEKLAAAFPDTTILAIDITPRAGRLYRGRAEGVEFRTATVQDIARDNPGQFDLVVMSDVVHHIPLALRGGNHRFDRPGDDARRPLRPQGLEQDDLADPLAVPRRRPLADRRSRDPHPPGRGEATRHRPGAGAAGRCRGRHSPWRNNYALVFAR